MAFFRALSMGLLAVAGLSMLSACAGQQHDGDHHHHAAMAQTSGRIASSTPEFPEPEPHAALHVGQPSLEGP